METNSLLFPSPTENKARVKCLSSQQTDEQKESKQCLFDEITNALNSKPQQEIIEQLEKMETQLIGGAPSVGKIFK